ncbi:hypothetical protein PC120_g27374 [Phytophthora cactorum]|nr:hypothetical protein PC120_g27374 [Phytophthora cactorum]
MLTPHYWTQEELALLDELCEPVCGNNAPQIYAAYTERMRDLGKEPRSEGAVAGRISEWCKERNIQRHLKWTPEMDTTLSDFGGQRLVNVEIAEMMTEKFGRSFSMDMVRRRHAAIQANPPGQQNNRYYGGDGLKRNRR